MSTLFISGGMAVDPQAGRIAPADILVRDGVIAAVADPGSLIPPQDAERICARGCMVSPGFIDPHGHIDGHARTGELSLLQGVTTSVGGNCGFSPVDIGQFFAQQQGFPIHQAEQVGLCALREAAGVMDPFVPADEKQLGVMIDLARKALRDGAIGVSLGPAYAPGTSDEEMLALCREAKACGRPVSIDTRMNSMTDLHSLQEAIDLAAATGCRMIVSHFTYQYGVGVEDEALAMVDAARAQGIDVWFDSGMYKDWCSSIGAALFDESVMRENSIELHHLRMISGCHAGEQPDRALYEHLRVAHPHDAVAVFTGSQEAVFTIARHPRAMISSDTGAYQPGEGHPQIAGSFPRFLRQMVREGRGVSWAEAIRRITLLPAQAFGLERKGRLQPGCDADLVIFDPETICDRADFPGDGRPDAAPEGIAAVIVSGRVAAQNGVVISGRCGGVVRA
ncbi:MAG: amidohydrolase family protein [Clostridia bacterium]|nr:amidohydrolase family protein [Clostridia bacterium]